MQVAAASRENRKRGGRRVANFGTTFAARRSTLMDEDHIKSAYLSTCTCDPQCGWKCANEYWDFSQRIEALREPRFTGNINSRPNWAHA